MLFVTGALGLELVGGALVERFGFDDIRYFAVATLEELLEMIGIAVFLFALMDYMARHGISIAVRFDAAAETGARSGAIATPHELTGQ